MKSTFANIVSSLPADYADLRFEENRKIRIGYEGPPSPIQGAPDRLPKPHALLQSLSATVGRRN